MFKNNTKTPYKQMQLDDENFNEMSFKEKI